MMGTHRYILIHHNKLSPEFSIHSITKIAIDKIMVATFISHPSFGDLQPLAPLDESCIHDKVNPPPILSNVDELETSLGKVQKRMRPLASLDEDSCKSSLPTARLLNADELETSLGKAQKQLRKQCKHPITICHEDIESKYHIDWCSELGRGKNTIVRKCVERSTGKRFAVKTCSKYDKQEIKHMRNEIELLCDLDHDNIIDLHAAYEDDRYLHMVTEICK